MPTNADEVGLGVIVALPAEAAGWRSRNSNCEVCVAGIGSDHARDAAGRLIKGGARALLSWGVAGGLSPSLRSGDLLLPRRVVALRGEWRTHDGWRERLLRVLPDVHEIDALHCSERPLVSMDDKGALARRGFAAVDMESAGVAEAAAQAGVPFIAVKAVCDPAARAVPALALRMLDRNGHLRVSAILEVARAGPRGWRELHALRGDFSAARASLRRAARMLPRVAEGIAP
ncbi:MAG TPA: hypothetical protein VGK80_09855 [Rhodanobacteraceae bacterium]